MCVSSARQRLSQQAGVTRNWAVILAGGAGRRLQPLTRQVTGDDRPKQYCSLLGRGTLLTETRTRVAQCADPFRTLCIVNREHQRYYRDELADLHPALLIAQPCDRGTAAAIAYGAARIHTFDDNAVVGFFPADHYYTNPARFHAAVAAAYDLARRHRDLIVLIGAKADHPETDYGWIEPGAALADLGEVRAFTVKRFWEKPVRMIARMLLHKRALWNTFVMVGDVEAFRMLLHLAAPPRASAFEPLRRAPSLDVEIALAEEVYARVPAWDFCQDVVASHPARCAVVPLTHAGWTDLGRPSRVQGLLDADGLRRLRRVRVAS